MGKNEIIKKEKEKKKTLPSMAQFPAPPAAFTVDSGRVFLQPRGVAISVSRQELWVLLLRELALFPYSQAEFQLIPAPIQPSLQQWLQSGDCNTLKKETSIIARFSFFLSFISFFSVLDLFLLTHSFLHFFI